MTRRRIAVLLAGALVLGACGADDDTAADATGDEIAATGELNGAASGFPVTIENCGIETTYGAPPQRAVVIYQHTTEVMLALGLEDRMVGTAYMDSSIRDDLVEAYEAVPEIAEKSPSREQVLAAEPDIVIAGWNSAFEDESAGSRESLAQLGIDSYLESSSCPDFDGAPGIELVKKMIIDVGAIFGVPDRADALVEQIMAPIDGVDAALDGIDPVDVFVYDSGTEQAYTPGGKENTTALIALAGGRNVFDDVDDTWAEVNLEDVVARDPDVVLILDYAGNGTVEEKQEFLRTNPATSTLTAVQQGRFVVAELTDVVPGIRNGDIVGHMARGFHPDFKID